MFFHHLIVTCTLNGFTIGNVHHDEGVYKTAYQAVQALNSLDVEYEFIALKVYDVNLATTFMMMHNAQYGLIIPRMREYKLSQLPNHPYSHLIGHHSKSLVRFVNRTDSLRQVLIKTHDEENLQLYSVNGVVKLVGSIPRSHYENGICPNHLSGKNLVLIRCDLSKVESIVCETLIVYSSGSIEHIDIQADRIEVDDVVIHQTLKGIARRSSIPVRFYF